MVRTPHCAQLTDRIKNQWWMEDISLHSGAMAVSGSLSVIEALGWPKRDEEDCPLNSWLQHYYLCAN